MSDIITRKLDIFLDKHVYFLYNRAIMIYYLNKLAEHPGFGFHIEYGKPTENDVPFHSHDFCEIVFVMSGSAVHDIEDESFPMHAGDVFVIREGISHRYRSPSEMSIINIMLRADDSELCNCYDVPGFWYLFRFVHSGAEAAHLTFDSADYSSLLATARLLYGEYSAAMPGYRSMCRSLIGCLTAQLSRAVADSVNVRGDAGYRVASVAAYMEYNYQATHTLSGLAALSGFSRRHFSRLFAEKLGVSPAEYLMSVRLNRAKEFLIRSEMNMTEISARCGFCDSNYFSRCFNNAFGKSPSAYRKSAGSK